MRRLGLSLWGRFRGLLTRRRREMSKSRRRTFRIEALESRHLLAIAPELISTNVVSISSPTNPDGISLTLNGQHYYVYDDSFHQGQRI